MSEEVNSVETQEAVTQEPIKEEFSAERFIAGNDNQVEEKTTELKPAETKQQPVKQTEPVAEQLDEYWGTFQSVVGDGYKIPDIVKLGKKEDGTPCSGSF